MEQVEDNESKKRDRERISYDTVSVKEKKRNGSSKSVDINVIAEAVVRAFRIQQRETEKKISHETLIHVTNISSTARIYT